MSRGLEWGQTERTVRRVAGGGGVVAIPRVGAQANLPKKTRAPPFLDAIIQCRSTRPNFDLLDGPIFPDRVNGEKDQLPWWGHAVGLDPAHHVEFGTPAEFALSKHAIEVMERNEQRIWRRVTREHPVHEGLFTWPRIGEHDVAVPGQ